MCDGQVIHGHHLPPSLQTAEASGTVTRVSLERRRRRLREGPHPGRAEDDARQPREGGAAARHDRARPELQRSAQMRHRRPPVYGVENRKRVRTTFRQSTLEQGCIAGVITPLFHGAHRETR